jgi:phage terminase Nu1 subunit (DNA packaging protein)
MVKNKKDKGQKWDGKSRVSNDLYRKRYNEIFKKVTDDNAEEMMLKSETLDLEAAEYLKELKKKL